MALGLTFGVVGALLLSRLMQGLLFGVAPNDPVTLVGVAVLMAAVGIGAVSPSLSERWHERCHGDVGSRDRHPLAARRAG